MMNLLSIKGVAVLVAVFGAGMMSWLAGSVMAELSTRQNRQELRDEQMQVCLRKIAEADKLEDPDAVQKKMLQLRQEYITGNPDLATVVDSKLLQVMMERIARTEEAASRSRRQVAEDRASAEITMQQAEQKIKLARELLEVVDNRRQLLKDEQTAMLKQRRELADKQLDAFMAQKKNSEAAKQLKALQTTLKAQSEQINSRMQELQKKEEAISKQLAKLENSRNSSPQIIVVPQRSAPSTSSLIIRESVPVYIGGWSRPRYWPYDPRKPHRHPDKSGVGIRIGTDGVKVQVRK